MAGSTASPRPRGCRVAEPPLPPLHEGVVDDAFLVALEQDLLAGTEVIEVLTRGGPTMRGVGGGRDVSGALAALRSGAVRGVQVRYRHGGTEWWDTVTRASPGEYRIVRFEQRWADPDEPGRHEARAGRPA